MILGLFFRSAVGYANETPWHLNYLLMIRDSTASIYETGENNWVSQMYGGGFSNLPQELGGNVPGDRSRFSGTPND